MSAATGSVPAPARAAGGAARAPAWWPLAALVALAAALRLGTLGAQSLWYDEAFTPLHVLHPSLWDTLRSVSRTENSPPLWYAIEWLDYRLLGTSEYALRLPSALAGIALVPVAWAICRELVRERGAAIACAALVAVGPLFQWYSQEARVYGLFTLTVGVAVLAFARVLREPTRRRWAAFAAAGALALLTHYFAVFVLAGMGIWLLGDPRTRRACLPALAALAAVALALLPLILAQGARNTQWIGHWALKERIEDIPGYYLTGYSGGRVGHSIEALVGLPLFGAAVVGLWRLARARRDDGAGEGDGASRGGQAGGESAPTACTATGSPAAERARAVWAMLTVSAAGVLIPLALALVGLDYMAPRNLVGAMVPVSALIALLGTWPGRDPIGPLLLSVGGALLLGVSLAVAADAKYQRGDWRGVVRDLPRARAGERAFVVNQLGSAPLRYYEPGLAQMPASATVGVREVVLAGEEPLRASAGRPPAPGFRLAGKLDFHGLVAYRFVAAAAQVLSERSLRRRSISFEHSIVLAPAGLLGDGRAAR